MAKNCNEPINEKGAEAKDWRGGKPLRVVRNCKGRKHSDYAPEEGNRYDGIYKVSTQTSIKYQVIYGLATVNDGFGIVLCKEQVPLGVVVLNER